MNTFGSAINCNAILPSDQEDAQVLDAAGQQLYAAPVAFDYIKPNPGSLYDYILESKMKLVQPA
jgi:hypothetical protein